MFLSALYVQLSLYRRSNPASCDVVHALDVGDNSLDTVNAGRTRHSGNLYSLNVQAACSGICDADILARLCRSNGNVFCAFISGVIGMLCESRSVVTRENITLHRTCACNIESYALDAVLPIEGSCACALCKLE